MIRQKSWGEYNKSILDKIIERLRFLQVIRLIKSDIRILDLGCGYDAQLLNIISSKISTGFGIDISINEKQKNKKITLIKGYIDKNIHLRSNYFDTITSLASIEHVVDPIHMLKEAHRLLKKDGIFILTTPSEKSKAILEFMAFKLKIISRKEIEDHKRYFSSKTLYEAFIRAGFEKNKIKVKTFEAGFNLFVTAIK